MKVKPVEKNSLSFLSTLRIPNVRTDSVVVGRRMRRPLRFPCASQSALATARRLRLAFRASQVLTIDAVGPAHTRTHTRTHRHTHTRTDTQTHRHKRARALGRVSINSLKIDSLAVVHRAALAHRCHNKQRLLDQ